MIPALLFLWLLWGFLERFAPDPAIRRLVLVAYALGSMAMTYSLLYYSHQLARGLHRERVDPRARRRRRAARPARDGRGRAARRRGAARRLPGRVRRACRSRSTSSCGCGVAARELVRALGIARRRRRDPDRDPARVSRGVLRQPAAHRLRRDRRRSRTFTSRASSASATLRWEAFWGSLFAPDNGLLVLSPWLLLAIPGGVVLWRRGERALVLAVAAVAVIYIAVHLVDHVLARRLGRRPALHHRDAAVPAAARRGGARRRGATTPLRARRACGTIVSAVVIYALVAATFPYWPDSLKNPLVRGDVPPARRRRRRAERRQRARHRRHRRRSLPFLAVRVGAARLGDPCASAAGAALVDRAASVGVAILARVRARPARTGPHAERAYAQHGATRRSTQVMLRIARMRVLALAAARVAARARRVQRRQAREPHEDARRRGRRQRRSEPSSPRSSTRSASPAISRRAATSASCTPRAPASRRIRAARPRCSARRATAATSRRATTSRSRSPRASASTRIRRAPSTSIRRRATAASRSSCRNLGLMLRDGRGVAADLDARREAARRGVQGQRAVRVHERRRPRRDARGEGRRSSAREGSDRALPARLRCRRSDGVPPDRHRVPRGARACRARPRRPRCGSSARASRDDRDRVPRARRDGDGGRRRAARSRSAASSCCSARAIAKDDEACRLVKLAQASAASGRCRRPSSARVRSVRERDPAAARRAPDRRLRKRRRPARSLTEQ